MDSRDAGKRELASARMKRILLAEDNAADVALLRRAFRESVPPFHLLAVDSVAAARTALEREAPDLLIVDVSLPDGAGTDLIDMARARGCPCIVLTGRGNEALAVQALQGGALDYVVKSDRQMAEMPQVATRALREWEYRQERERNARLLAQSEERFRTFAELAADWFWEADASARMTFVSEGFGRLSHLQPQALIGVAMPEILRAHCSEMDWQPVAQSWQAQQAFELEFPFAANGQAARIIHLRGVPFFSDGRVFGGYRGIARDVTHERETLARITHLAMHDPLTGVLNRRSLEASVKLALLGSAREREAHAFCYFDLDQFKQVNDDLGHAAGDVVLQAVVAAIAGEVRAGDSLGRLGGDEFGLLLRHCAPAKAGQLAARIVQAVALRRIPVPGRAPVCISVSAGVAALQEGLDVERVFQAADQACYRSKRAGGNQVSMCTEAR